MTDERPYVAVGAIVIHDDALLMIRRAQDPGRGLWSIPGGRVEHGEYISDALRREVNEETGLEVDVGPLVGILEVVGEPHYVIHDYACTLTSDATPTAGDDVDEVRWVPLDDVHTLDCTPRFVETMRAWGVLTAPST
jgi:ADP-ribose pyrophosphatase YjhB (NUDIX family)